MVLAVREAPAASSTSLNMIMCLVQTVVRKLYSMKSHSWCRVPWMDTMCAYLLMDRYVVLGDMGYVHRFPGSLAKAN